MVIAKYLNHNYLCKREDLVPNFETGSISHSDTSPGLLLTTFQLSLLIKLLRISCLLYIQQVDIARKLEQLCTPIQDFITS